MSLQRARISCEECYGLSNTPFSFLYRHAAYEARVNAMTALERVQDYYRSFELNPSPEEPPNKKGELFMMDLGLRKCVICADNGKKSPEIAELLQLMLNRPQLMTAQDSGTSPRT